MLWINIRQTLILLIGTFFAWQWCKGQGDFGLVVFMFVEIFIVSICIGSHE